ncbi:MAG: oxidoreductase-like domain-containing protein [Balneolaceae bacterium]|nr:oxidoreductase-like domain-containing protein [Balneolaceae bacterium]
MRYYLKKTIFGAIMKEPEKPLPTDCCGSGCERCVYDIYVEQLKQYKAWKKSQSKEQQKAGE